VSFIKDPDDKRDYAVDWSTWLTNEGDTAASVQWITPAGIVRENNPAPSLTGGKATAWWSGGTDGVDYPITCRLTTTAGRVIDRTLTIKVRSR
jgi:hypothetical protein